MPLSFISVAVPDVSQVTTAQAEDRARTLLAEGLSRRDAATQLARELNLPRNEAYRLVTAV